MRVNEILMRPGGWSLELTASAPQDIVKAIRAAIGTYDSTTETWSPVLDGQVVVFDTDTDVPTLASARYCGPVREQTGIRSFAGPGVAAYLQSDEGLGQLRDTSVTRPAQTLSDWLDDLLPTNGITKGTATNTGLSSLGMTHEVPAGRREMLDAVCARMGAEWRINPNGTLDAAKTGTLFRSTPEVLVSDRPQGVGAGLRGIKGNVTEPSINATGVTSKTIVYGKGEGDQIIIESVAKGSAVGKGLGGGTLVHERAINSPGDDADASAALATATLALFSVPRSSYSIISSATYVRRAVAPGDNVWVSFPSAGIVGTNPVTFRGESVYPQRARVQQLNWGVHKGHGVYLRRHNGTTETWLRLTPWVQFADADAFWKVGTGSGSADTTALTGQSRLGEYGVVA